MVNSFRVRVVLSSIFAWLTTCAGQVTTYHYDNSRTGTTLSETTLTTSNVNVASFGKLFSLAVDGQVYAQPLYLPGVSIPQRGLHNVLYVATDRSSVYAFDADSPGGPLWQASLGPSSARRGMASTPVIDPALGILYVVAESIENSETIFRLHALDVTTGLDKLPPSVIQAGEESRSGSLRIPGASLEVAAGKDGETYVFYNSTLFVSAEREPLKAFSFNGSQYNTIPDSQSTFALTGNGAALSVSANGLTPGTGVVWAASSADGVADGRAHPGVVYAFDAADLSRVLWSSDDNRSRDAAGNGIRWSPPMVANGRMYLGTSDNSVNVYGLLSPAAIRTNTPRAGGAKDAIQASGPALVQQAAGSNVGNNQNTLTVTLGARPGSGNVLMLFFGQVSAAQTITSISGATWTRVAQNFAGNVGDSEIWVGTNPTSSTITITGTNYFGVFQPGYAIVSEISGVGTTLDNIELNTAGGSWPVTTGTLTTANANDLLLTMALSYNGGGAQAFVPSPWAVLNAPGGTYSLAAGYQFVTAAGTYAATWNGNGSPQVATIILALKTAGSTGSIIATAGTPQSATINTAFTTALQATVKDANNNPVSGVTVTFTAPSTGASGTFGGSATATATTNGSGVATAPALTAGGQAGTWTLLASAPGISPSASFSLSNLAGAPASLSATGGTPQSAAINTGFAAALQATVKDAGNNPVSGVTVTFTAPSSGASGTFSGSASATAVTNGSGVAIAPSLTANGQSGSYTVTASAAGLSANFSLTNLAGVPASISATAGTAQSATINAVFATALQATVKDANNNTLSGVTVTFTAPSSGASATFSGSATATAVTNSSGIATAPALTANGQAGSYTVSAAAPGVGTSASFSLSNLAGAPASITATAGTPQTATVNTAFSSALQVVVKDAGNNLLNGVTVTFSAPVSGASASFGGSNTATAITNASGIATVTAPTAGTTAGSYTITASAGGVGPASFSLTNTAVVSGGGSPALTGSGTSSTATANLTSEGTSDWVHWGDSSLTRKAGVSPQISNYSVVGFNGVNYYSNDPRALSWTDGTPTASGNNYNGIYINSLQNGFSLTAPADTGTRVLTVHVGGWLSGGTLTAHLSDSSAADYVDSTTPASGQYDRNYTLTYSAASAGQTLTVSWVATSGAGNVTLNGAALAGGTAGTGSPASIGATAGTPQSATINTGFATALLATVKDAGNNPVSGVTVTFTAPSSGASATFSGSASATAVTNGSGVATAPALIANGQAGPYTVAATVSGVGTSAIFNLTNLAGVPASISATAGTPQSATINTGFATALQATVRDGNNNALSGVTVTFTVPSSGPGATFSGSVSSTAVTNASGIATAPALTANGQAGTYTVSAAVAGVGSSASFSLSNLAGPPASITSTAGTPQTATVNSAFAAALQVVVKDAGNNLLSGVTVTFTAPATGASASFGGSNTTTAITNGSGIATVAAPTAGGIAGSYTITATAGGAGPASFSLTNTPAVATGGGSPALVQQAAGSNVGNNQNTLTVTLGAQPASGNVLMLFFGQVSASQTITSISGATWTRVAQNFAGNIGDSEVWVGTNPTSSTITITGTNYFGVFQPGYAIVSEFSGVGTTVDGIALNTAGGSWPVATGSLTTSSANDLVVTMALSYNGGGIYATVLNPWTVFTAPGGTYSLAAGYQFVTATGTYAATWSGFGSPQVATVILALKAASTGSTSATAGTPQSAPINTGFATPLQATVKNASNNPVSGVTVTFTAPSTGASGTFSGSATATAVTNASGIATAPTLTANGQAGAWTLLASAPGISPAASFSLNNLAGAPASIRATAGTPQTATINTLFSAPLQATVSDANNNALSGVTVTFTAPASGASATFSGSATATAVTNSSGIATAPALTANGQSGSFTVTAAVAGVGAPASFSLTNSTAPLVPITRVQQAQIDSMIDIPTLSVSFASPNTAGNWIGVAIFGGQSNTHLFTVTDTNGNTYKRALTVGNTPDNITLGMYYAENIKGGSNQITVVPDTSGYIRIVIVEYSGVATSNSLDVTAAAQGNSVSPNSGTVNTTANGDLLWGASASADADPSAGPGFTLDALVPQAPGTALTTEDQIQMVAGPASASLTFSSAKYWTMGLAAIRRAP